MRHMQFDVKFLEFLCTKRKVGCLSATSEEHLLTLKDHFGTLHHLQATVNVNMYIDYSKHKQTELWDNI